MVPASLNLGILYTVDTLEASATSKTTNDGVFCLSASEPTTWSISRILATSGASVGERGWTRTQLPMLHASPFFRIALARWRNWGGGVV